MKYLQINTVVSYTSVGRIMRQNYDEKKAQGWDCLIAYGRGTGMEGYNTIKIGTALDCRLQGIWTRLFDRHGYGSKKATKKFIAKMEEYKPDVIHLHNIHGYYINFEILFMWLKEHPERKVIWTLHDCWVMTGHCAYFTAVKCDRWKTQCLQCPQKGRYPSSFLLSNACNNFTRKKKAFTGVAGMTLVVPSHWMEGIVKESFLKGYEIEVIHNKIDTSIFKPTSSNFREKYRLENKKIILGVANVWEERKGLNDFIKLSQMLDEQFVIVLVGLNKKQIKKISSRIKNVKMVSKFEIIDLGNNSKQISKHEGGTAIPPGIDNLYCCVTEMLGKIAHNETEAMLVCMERTANAKELAAIYTMADVFVNPTYEDNYPTVNLEALACGTPVVTYDTGGCRETLIR